MALERFRHAVADRVLPGGDRHINVGLRNRTDDNTQQEYVLMRTRLTRDNGGLQDESVSEERFEDGATLNIELDRRRRRARTILRGELAGSAASLAAGIFFVWEGAKRGDAEQVALGASLTANGGFFADLSRRAIPRVLILNEQKRVAKEQTAVRE